METRKHSKKFFDVLIAEGVYFNDNRGFLKKTIFGDKFTDLMPEVRELITSKSLKNVIRGIHFQLPPKDVSKFISCVSGEIIDVFVDLRKSSNSYGEVGYFELNENDNKAIFIPKGFGHGYIVKSEVAIVTYLQSGDYDQNYDSGINPNSINYDWGTSSHIISKKDAELIDFEEFISPF